MPEHQRHNSSIDIENGRAMLLQLDCQRRLQHGFDASRPYIAQHARMKHMQAAWVEFLEAVYNRTSYAWKPGECNWSVDVVKAARDIGPNILDPNMTATLMVTKPSMHVWTKISLPALPDLCIDGAGVIDPNVGRIIPYFGLRQWPILYGYPLTSHATVYNGISQEFPQEKEKMFEQSLLDVLFGQ